MRKRTTFPDRQKCVEALMQPSRSLRARLSFDLMARPFAALALTRPASGRTCGAAPVGFHGGNLAECARRSSLVNMPVVVVQSYRPLWSCV